MRLMKSALIAGIALVVTGFISPPARAEVSFSAFYSNLSPYGSWQVSAQYGRVWQPADYRPGWNPYLDGHWVDSDLGWTWVSDYDWGAVPYHYGTWVSDPENGWVWVPGYTWAPAWVVFRTGPDFIGWAPVSPGFSVGVTSGFSGPSGAPFLFVSARDFLAPRVRTCIVPQSRTTVIINNTRVVNNLVVENNVVVNRGPDPRIIERATGRPVRVMPIEHISRAMPGPRISRAQLAVDPERVRHGLRAAEPVSATKPLPAIRQREGGLEGRHGVQATKEGSAANTPRAPRRLTSETQTPSGENANNGHGVYPSARDRYQPPESNQSQKASQGPGTSNHQVARSPRTEHQPSPASATPMRGQEPSRSKPSAHKDDKKPHDSDKP